MCLPQQAAAIGGGGALSLIGEGLNTREANKNAKRQTSAYMQQQGLEDQRQAEYRARAQAGLQRALDQYGTGKQGASFADLLGKREAATAGNVTDATPGAVPIREDAPNVVKETLGKRLNTAVAEGREGAKRLAALGARDDQSFANKIGLSRSGEDIATASNFAAASAGINPVERAAAFRGAYRDPSGLGDLFKLFGRGSQLWGFMGTPGLGGGGTATVPGWRQGGGK